MKHIAKDVEKSLRKASNHGKVAVYQGFFKTGKGEYGEGDVFLGVSVPNQRKIAREYRDISLQELTKLLNSPFHECRLTGLLILVLQYERTPLPAEKKKVFDFYLAHRRSINNWDLVDATTPNIMGDYLLRQYQKGKSSEVKKLLSSYARSTNLWERRMAMLSTFTFLRNGKPEVTLFVATLLLHDPHDLIHKAVGWMIREVGKRCDETILIDFLDQHAATMPRTMLSYAIERLSPAQKKHYLSC